MSEPRWMRGPNIKSEVTSCERTRTKQRVISDEGANSLERVES